MKIVDQIRKYAAAPWTTKAVASRLGREHRRTAILGEIAGWFPGALTIPYPTLEDPIEHFRSRSSPRFYWDSASLLDSIAALPEKASQEIIVAAHEYRSGIWRFRGGAAMVSTEGIPWDCTAALEELGRDLHRLEWLVDIVLAGLIEQDDSALIYVVEALDTWVDRSGPSSRYWGDMFEVAQRSESLLWLLFLTRNSPAMPSAALGQLLACLAASGRLLFGMLEYHRPNNHLIVQAMRLAELGMLLPEADGSDRWRTLGYDVSFKEIEHQILPDGVHAERSIFYHRIVLDALLQFRAMQQRNSVETPGWVDRRLRGMLRFQRAMRRPDGNYPQYNDGYMSDIYIRLDAGRIGRTLLDEGITENTCHARTCLVSDGLKDESSHINLKRLDNQGLYYFPDGGFVVHNDTANCCQLSFRCGKLGYPASPAHMHADPLAIEIFDHEPFIVSSGTYSFNNEVAKRNDFRGTAAHNCLTIDNKDAVKLYGRFGVGRLPNVIQRTLLDAGDQMLVEATHDGYARTGAVHSRIVVSLGTCSWLVVDSVDGSGVKDIDLWWHLHPTCSTTVRNNQADVTDRNGAMHQLSWFSSARLSPELKHGGERGYEGWFSGNTGELLARDTITLRSTTALPFVNATIIRRNRIDRQPTGSIKIANPVPLAFEICESTPHESDGRISVFWRDDNRILICVLAGSFLRAGEISVETTTQDFLIQVKGDHCNAIGERVETIGVKGIQLSSATINGNNARLSASDHGFIIEKDSH